MASATPPINIDGSHKEGGGQILRNAVAYAVLLQKSVTISNIRANRPNSPGVRPQHLAGMRLAVEVGGRGELVGAEEMRAKCMDDGQGTAFVADTGTAGSIALLLQAALLPAIAEAMRQHPQANPAVTIELKGGTNATGAPQIDYVTDVFAPFINSYLQQFEGASNQQQSTDPPITIEVVRRGYYPRGGGIVRVNLRPPPCRRATLPPIKLTQRPPIQSITVKAFHAGNCPAWVAEEMASSALKELKRAFKLGSNPRFRERFSSPDFGSGVQISHVTDCLGSGSGILICATPDNSQSRDGLWSYPALASSALGDRKVRPQQTGINAAQELVECIASRGCVDRWLQDQLIPFMALADGGADGNEMSEVLVGELTLHTQTAIWVAEKMTGCQFEVENIDADDGEGSMDVSNSQHYGSNSQHYGENGRELGRHIIRCKGIGFSYA